MIKLVKPRKKIVKRALLIVTIVVLIFPAINFFFSFFLPFSSRDWPKPLLQRVKIEHNQTIAVHFNVPKCIDYQTIFLDFAFHSREDMEKFDKALERCTKQLPDGNKYSYQCLDNPVQWAIYNENGMRLIKGEMEKIPVRGGRDIYTASLGKDFLTAPLGGISIPPLSREVGGELLPPGNYLFKAQLINQIKKPSELYLKITASPWGATATECRWFE